MGTEDIWTREYVVVLKIKVDTPVGTRPEWWEVIDFPPPWRWDEHFPETVHVTEALAEELMS